MMLPWCGGDAPRAPAHSNPIRALFLQHPRNVATVQRITWYSPTIPARAKALIPQASPLGGPREVWDILLEELGMKTDAAGVVQSVRCSRPARGQEKSHHRRGENPGHWTIVSLSAAVSEVMEDFVKEAKVDHLCQHGEGSRPREGRCR